MSASTVGGVELLRFIVVKSNTTTEELPLPTNKVLPSALTSRPSGPDIGFTPLPREAQHCAPGNAPKLWLAPKPVMRWNVGPGGVAVDMSVLHPWRVKFPNTSMIGGMRSGEHKPELQSPCNLP